MFVPEDMRPQLPKIKQLTESYLDEIFLFGNGTVVSINVLQIFICFKQH